MVITRRTFRDSFALTKVFAGDDLRIVLYRPRRPVPHQKPERVEHYKTAV